MDDQQRRFRELEQQLGKRRSLFTDSRLYNADLQRWQRLEHETFRMKELLELTGKPQGEWASKKKTELLNQLEGLLRSRGWIYDKLHGDRPYGEPIDPSYASKLSEDIKRIDEEMKDVRELLRLL